VTLHAPPEASPREFEYPLPEITHGGSQMRWISSQTIVAPSAQ
jgi:hypothetical protein